MFFPETYIEPLARAGYASRGVVYLIIGAFAALAAFGGGQAQNSEGALQTLFSQPLGTLLVALMVAGLIGYVIWRLVQSIADLDGHGRSAKGLAIRLGLLASAFTYATLAIYALSQLGLASSGSAGESGGGVAKTIAGIVGARPVAIGLALIFLGVGGAHCWKAVRTKFEERFDLDEARMKFVRPIAIGGLIARGLVFFILAFLLFYRGLRSGNGDENTPGIKEAMEFLLGLPMGNTLLALMGAGIMLFALYSFAEALWRRVETPAALSRAAGH